MKMSPRRIATATVLAAVLTFAMAGCASLLPKTGQAAPRASHSSVTAPPPAVPTSLAEAGVTGVRVFYDKASSIPLTKPAQGPWLHKNLYSANLHVAVTFTTPAAAAKYRIQTEFYNPSTKKLSAPATLGAPYCTNPREAGADVNWITSFTPPREWTVIVRLQAAGSAWGPWIKVGAPSSTPTPCPTAA